MTDRDRPMAQISVLLFDVMGTVVDDEGSIANQGRDILGRCGWSANASSALVTDWQKRHGAVMNAVVTGQRPWLSHRALRAETLDAAIAAAAGPTVPGAAVTELQFIISRLSPWPDTADALARIRESRLTVALSNADTIELAELSAAGGLSWHAVLSGELAPGYKPDPAVYEMALRMLSVEPARVLMVAAHPWDLRAAAEHGMATAFVARPGAELPRADDHFNIEVADLAELATLTVSDAESR